MCQGLMGDDEIPFVAVTVVAQMKNGVPTLDNFISSFHTPANAVTATFGALLTHLLILIL